MKMKIAPGLFFLIASMAGVSAMGQTPSISEHVNAGAMWVEANPGRSCRIVCESVGSGWKAVPGPGTSQKTHPEYVCARKANGVPGANHTYSTKVAAVCHYQAKGDGHYDANFSCLCALN